MASKKWYRLLGRVTDASTSRSLAGLHVRGYDKDPVWDDCLGSDHTDAAGEFVIEFMEGDLKEVPEGRPEIYIVVYDQDRNRVRPSIRSGRVAVDCPIRMRNGTSNRTGSNGL